jgi:hypothetical protein
LSKIKNKKKGEAMKHHNNDSTLICPIHHTIYCDNNDS